MLLTSLKPFSTYQANLWRGNHLQHVAVASMVNQSPLALNTCKQWHASVMEVRNRIDAVLILLGSSSFNHNSKNTKFQRSNSTTPPRKHLQSIHPSHEVSGSFNQTESFWLFSLDFYQLYAKLRELFVFLDEKDQKIRKY